MGVSGKGGTWNGERWWCVARFRRFREQFCVSRMVFQGQQNFKIKLEYDSDIDQSGCTALPTCRRHVVNGTHGVGVSVLNNQLRDTHARHGHWLWVGDSLSFTIRHAQPTITAITHHCDVLNHITHTAMNIVCIMGFSEPTQNRDVHE